MTDEMTPETDETVAHYAVKEAAGQTFEVQLTPAEDTKKKVLYCPTGRVIPIVYIHGMLSAALKAKGQKGVRNGTNVWKVPPNAFAGIGSVLGSLEFFGYNAAKCQIRFDPKTTEVDYKGAVKWWYDSVKRKDAATRGWGAVWGMGEQPFLDKLQGSLDHLKTIKLKEISQSKKEFDWYALLNTDPAQYGGVTYEAMNPVTEEELEIMQKYQFDVWVAAYNWLDAHEIQAKEVLMKRIKEDILGHYKGCADAPEKVIIVTHSLGGLASRTFTQLTEGGEDLVWGVNHSCQPAEGTPTAYHHVRCGYYDADADFMTRASTSLFGSRTNYTTPVMANAPGLLALLPFPTFQNSEPWLFIHKPDDAVGSKTVLAMPQKADGSDIYETVYQAKTWYAVLPEKDEVETKALLNPAQLKDPEGLEAPVQVVSHDMFFKAVERIADFQEKLHNGGYHKMTFAHAESQFGTKSRTWNHVQWEVLPNQTPSEFSHLLGASIEQNGYHADHRTNQLRLSDGSITQFLSPHQDFGWANVYGSAVCHYDLEGKKVVAGAVKTSDKLVATTKNLWHSGDGTVAAASGEAPFVADIKGGYFLHGSKPVHLELRKKFMEPRLQDVVTQSEEQANKPFIPPFHQADYGHATALADELTYFSTLHAIVKIVANVVDKELS